MEKIYISKTENGYLIQEVSEDRGLQTRSWVFGDSYGVQRWMDENFVPNEQYWMYDSKDKFEEQSAING